MQTWLREKIDHITTEFLAGGGHGAVYEAQFLAYLECGIKASKGNPTRIWTEFTALCVEAAAEGEPPRSYSCRITDRQELVDALRTFQRRFETPRKARFAAPSPPAQTEPVTSSSEGEALGLFDLLTGED